MSRWDFSLVVIGSETESEPVELLGQLQLVGMAPWTGISVGVDARGPASPPLRKRRGPFRYSGQLRSVTYTPGEVRVPAPVIAEIEAAAEASAD